MNFPPLSRLILWNDCLERDGSENMAVDEWLLETTPVPVLRIYLWRGQWGSIGCFNQLMAASIKVPNVRWVRRITGGGVVDHQKDWTYSLVIPKTEALASLRGDASYEIVHQALASSFEDRFNLSLNDGGSPQSGSFCFENPVRFDLSFQSGEKFAGAGQRRSRKGLLHQGSVAFQANNMESIHRASRLAGALAEEWWEETLVPDRAYVDDLVEQRYGNSEWTGRR